MVTEILAAGMRRADIAQMQAAMESCPAKTVIAGGMGFALGGAFGLFMSSVSPHQHSRCMQAS